MKTRLRTLKTKGFALVATLSLMILLTLIAVGLLTLSTVTVRSGGREEAMATARANARLALMIALGELQKTMGPDQGVSAPAAAVYADKTAQRPHLTGVWKGWHWTPTPDGSPKYDDKKDQFARWLVSTTNPDDAKKFELPKSAAPTGTDSVRLVGSATTLKDSQGISTQVLAEKVGIGDPNTPSGKYAWAVFDESTKASIQLGDPTTPLKNGEEIASRTVPNRVRADVLDAKLGKLKTPEKLYSLDTAVLPVGVGDRDEISKRFHDFTTGSVGLLTDTANGGLKKDLTPLFEADPLPSQAFPVATVYPSAFGPTYGPPTWAYLRNHYQKYKTISAASGVPTYNSRTGGDMTVTRGGSNGVISTPTNERLIPVIARFQMVFSVVTHDIFNVQGRPAWWTQNGKPKYQKDSNGNPNYGVLNLAYDPVVTLYNPYDVALDLTKIRFRIWDPPVAFRFKKYEYLTDQATGNFMAKRVVKEGYFRPTSTNDGFAGLAEFQVANQSNTNARKCFTLILSEGTGEALTGQLKLQPGEVKVFSPRVEKAWTWGVETAGGFNQKGTFFDFAQEKKFANMDTRASANQFGPFGIECAPGWDGRAGLQTDHLALNAPRPSDTEYDFEASRSDGFVTLRSWDPIEVEVKPLVRSGNAAYHFQVDVLAATTQGSVPDTKDLENDSSNTGVRDDTLRSYKFNFSSLDPSKEISETPDAPVIKTKKLTCQELLQAENDTTKGGKYSFAMLELSARNTLDSLTDSKPWLHNNLVVEGGLQNSSIYGLTHQSYDLRLKKLEGTVDTFPRGIELDPDTYRGYYGASGTVGEGSSFVTMNHVPLAPAASLGDLIPANLAASALMPRAVHPFGNSYSHPLVPADKVSKGLVVDHPYLLNDSLWDSYFFSSFADYAGGVISTNRSLKDVIKGTLDGSKPALNTRLLQIVSGDPSKLADTISALDALNRSKQIGKYTGINGAFNVNSASVDAWRAVLSSLRDRAIYGLKVSGQHLQDIKDATYNKTDETPFVRTGKPLADESETGALRWSAFRTLSDSQIETLAEEIVKQIALRGKADSAPSMTLGEFVNRRISRDTLQREAGLLQTAIDATDINKAAYGNDSKTVSAASINDVRKKGIENTAALDGNSAEGVPTVITQGDLMAALAPIATVRGDTFKIRAYGEALDATGKIITARAWCEAIVQRVPDYVDPADAPEVALSDLTSQVNKDFGRQFRIVSFKQLSEDEL